MLVLTFQVGGNRLALDIQRVTEVVPRVRLTRPAGSPAWLAGVFVYRGQVVPVLDLHRLVGEGVCPLHLSSRIILVPFGGDEDRLLGLLAAQVADIRDIPTPTHPGGRLTEPGQPDLGPIVVADGGVLHLLDVDRLLPATARQQLALTSGELPP
jgi:chemotaxis-related protein WspB